ncbi:MAG TPA: hypothetical protein VJO99_26590 [Burkholderiaceae bacterium]|nr:hypothetical protein [Burkholderiaceae bacterium]
MLPNADRAVIEASKVRDYLLSPVHPVGRFKSVVFTAFGYSQEGWERLRDDLLVHARDNTAALVQTSEYGQKFEVSGMLTGPSGRSGRFVSIWILSAPDQAPKLVTAYPE